MNFIINNLIPPHFAMKFDLHEKLKKLVELWRWKINFRRNVFNDNKVQVLSTFYDMKALHFFSLCMRRDNRKISPRDGKFY